MKPISIQLYTLRDECRKDFAGVLKRVAAIGYKGVEPAGFFDLKPLELRRIVEDLGMVISSTHSPWVRPDTIQQVIEACGDMGVKLAAAGWGPQEFKDLDAIRRTATIAAEMDSSLRKAGITLVVHNHAWEFEALGGRIKHEIFAEMCPKVQFELDTYWAANFGENDPAEMVRRFASRAPLLHIKDGPLTKPEEAYNPVTHRMEIRNEAPLLPVGSGKNDINGIIRAMDPAVTQWLVVEQDTCDADVFECVKKSYRYLIENGLAEGNKG